MTYSVGPKGQVVIPKPLRDDFGIEPGDEMEFWREGDHIAMRPRTPLPDLFGRFAGTDLTATLMAERALDRARDK